MMGLPWFRQEAGEDLELLDYSFIEYWVRKIRGRPMDRISGRNHVKRKK